MTGAIWNLLLGLAWVLLSGDFSGLNLLVGMTSTPFVCHHQQTAHELGKAPE